MKRFFSLLIAFILLCGSLAVAQPGALDLSFDPGLGSNGIVHCMALQPDGKIIIGGFFTSYNGTARNRIARVNTDASIDTTFNPGTGASDYVYATTIQPDGKIIIGGRFLSYDGVFSGRIARLNTDGSLDTTFNTGTGFTDIVWAISIQPDGKIIIGGSFTLYNGTPRSRIARLNADGSVDTTFNSWVGADNTVFTTSIQPDGKIIIAGNFDNYKGIGRIKIARINADASLDTSFDPGTGANWYIICTDIQPDGKIMIGGDFFIYDGIGRMKIARLDTDGSLDLSFAGAGPSDEVRDIIIQPDGKIVLGGFFVTYNGTPSLHLVRVNSNGSLDTFFDIGTGASSYVFSMALQPDGKIIIGGSFNNYNGTGRIRIARLHGACFETTNTINVAACDSFVSPSGNYTWTVNGTYLDTILNETGCDSVMTINLSIDTTYNINDNSVVICNGDSTLLYGSYETVAGTHYDSLTTVCGLDSVHFTILTVNPTYNINDSPLTICNGDSALIYGNYETTSGTYYDTLNTINGCDSVYFTVLTVNPFYTINNTIVICSGDSALIYGNYETVEGTYYDSLTTIYGCDSVYSTALVVDTTYNINDNPVVICNGDSALIYGNYETISGTYYDSLTTVCGLDSIHFTILTVNLTYNINDAPIDICNGDSTLIYGNYETISGTYYDSLTTINGCDSVYSTILTVNPTYTIIDTPIIMCFGDSALIYGNYETANGTFYNYLTTINGCDSIHSTFVTVYPTWYINQVPINICNGDSALMYGNYETTAGTYYDSLTTINGCDSVYTRVLSVDSIDTSVTQTGDTLTSNATGATYQWYDCNSNSIIVGETGQLYTPGSPGSYAVIVTQNGCTDTSVCYTIVGISENTATSKIIIYPNPTPGKFTVQGATGEIQVYDLFGRKVLESKEAEIDMRGYTKGVYFVRVGEVVRKLVLH